MTFLIDTLQAAAERSVTLCPIGPLTNIALAFAQEPSLAAKVERIVLMGGARDLGNMTPAAEFNFFVDPHAAAMVLRLDVPIVMFGLHVTHQAIATPERVGRIAALGTPVAHAIHGMLRRERPGGADRYGVPGHPLHDVCAIAYLLWPDLFTGRDCHVTVETASETTIGRSTIDWWGSRRAEAERPCDRPRRRGRLLRAADRVAGQALTRHRMKHLVDELKAKADENIAAMRDAALRARDTHARAELMRHMLMTADKVKSRRRATRCASSSITGSRRGGSPAQSWPHVAEMEAFAAAFHAYAITPSHANDDAVRATCVRLELAFVSAGMPIADQMAWRSICAHGWWAQVRPPPPGKGRPDRGGPDRPFWENGCLPECL